MLESNSWVFYRAKYDCCTKNDCGGAHLPLLLLAQFTAVGDIDTQDLDARLEIKCWTPADACYDGDWVKWKERQKQLISTVSIAEVALTKVLLCDKEREEGWEENCGACDSHSAAARALAVEICGVWCRPAPAPGAGRWEGEGGKTNAAERA